MLTLRLHHALLGRGDRRDLVFGPFYLAAIAWLPLLVIAVVERITRGEVEPLLQDAAVHTRLLFAVPLLPYAYALVARQQDAALERLVDEGYPPQPAVVRKLAAGMSHWSSSPAALLALLIVVVTASQLVYWGVLSSTGIVQSVRLEHPAHGPAGRWYAWVALPLFQFLLLHVLVRWLLWCSVLVRIAGLRLRTAATHPDLAGGLGFLVRPSLALSVAVLAVGAVIAAGWTTEITRHGVDLMSYRTPLTVWVVLVVIIAFGPLFAFTPLLIRTRYQGNDEYGRLALTYSRRFHGRWIHPDPDPELLGSSHIQSLNDMGGSFGYVERTRLVPFAPRDVLVVGVTAILPMVPLVLSVVPMSQLLGHIAKALM